LIQALSGQAVKAGSIVEHFERKEFSPCFLATGVGSLPHLSVDGACLLIARTLPQTPFWPQLPKHSLLESMNVQASPGLPFLKVEALRGEVRLDPTLDEAEELEKVYQAYLTGEVESYDFPPGYAEGFEGMIRYLRDRERPDLRFFKGQMVGPVTFGLAIQDGRKRNVIHNEVVFDGLLKGLILRGRWIIGKMKTVCPKVIFFLDEPGLSGYGSAFFTVDGETITARLNEIIGDFQAQGALVGVHCCGNTDWALLMKTKADIISFDAWGFFDRFSLYHEAIHDFLGRDGILAWGIVPTSEFTGGETLEGLGEKLEGEFRELARRGISQEFLHQRCLLTPSCGMGLMSLEDTEKAMELLVKLSARMREKYFCSNGSRD
jgi:hypothetical protein